ncbi:ATP-binding protein [Parasphingorhabdus sp.]|uniref:ATP-binding protein n=1 Tax=Parasphingorhabdus sp. TaxID=2709688 RepID=UPI003A95253E
MTNERLQKEAVLRIGEVVSVNGRSIAIQVDKDKNLSELYYDGDLLKNIAVGSYVDIRKGYLSLIGKVDGENAKIDSDAIDTQGLARSGKRFLSVSLVGFLDRRGEFSGGTKELPLVGNEAYLLTKSKVYEVHNLVAKDGIALNIASSDYEGYEIALPVDGLMNSHIAIFGNTGSGKSNTLAALYQNFIQEMRARNEAAFSKNCKIVIFDFNGEYSGENCLTDSKHVYSLSTRIEDGDKIPLQDDGLLDIEMLSIIADATEKTQKPFLRRSLSLRTRIMSGDDPLTHTRNSLKSQIRQILQMSDKIRADLLLDYLRQILPEFDAAGNPVELTEDLDWNNKYSEFTWNGNYLKSDPDQILNTQAYQQVDNFNFQNDIIADFITFSYIQLIYDVLSNRAQNEHIAPAINKLRSKQRDIRKIFDPSNKAQLFDSNVIVINLHDVNLEMKKTIPLLLSRKIYQDHKKDFQNKSLSIVIDEAHNILSKESSREAESWKDYRLETFEEIIKEGRKFGVFVTIASQRPNDISHTITSQAHNYFIHRLVNQKDLQSISSAVSYIDKLTEESIPTLPTGTCIFSGIAGQMPLKLTITELPLINQPKSTTTRFAQIVPPQES